jgi:hypothetical protein
MVLFPDSTVGFNEFLELLGCGQSHEVAGNKKLVVEPGGGIFDFGLIFVGTEDEANGRVVPCRHNFGFPKVEVKIHLSGVSGFEGTDFQVDK